MTRPSLLVIVARLCLIPAAAGSAVLALAAREVQAQVQPVAPYYAVVSAPDTVLRCGDWEKLYAIAKLKEGQVVRVDGESAEWCRVSYPAGVGAFVDGEFASATADGTVVRLTQPTKLKAANLSAGLRGSWKPVLEEALPAGTELKVIERIAAGEASREAFRVAPPAAARAFVARGQLRRATEAEVAAYREAFGGGDVPPSGATATPGPALETPAGSPNGAGENSLVEPIVRPNDGGAPAEMPDAPAVADESGREPPKEPEPGSLEALDLAFESVRKQPIMEAEIDELLVEFEKKLASIEETSDQASFRAQVSQRIELLKIRQDLQGQLRELASARRSIDEEAGTIDQRVREVTQTRQYNLVGRLTTSTAYDGVRLPRMYRVQSVGGAYARTLGYVKPDLKLEIEPKVGLVVGVVGASTLDPSLRLNIITPERIDVLTPEGR